MAIIQKHETNFAIQHDEIPLDGVEYYKKSELKKLVKSRLDKTHERYDGDDAVPLGWLGIDEIETE